MSPHFMPPSLHLHAVGTFSVLKSFRGGRGFILFSPVNSDQLHSTLHKAAIKNFYVVKFTTKSKIFSFAHFRATKKIFFRVVCF
jgi:hypothetical protein